MTFKFNFFEVLFVKYLFKSNLKAVFLKSILFKWYCISASNKVFIHNVIYSIDYRLSMTSVVHFVFIYFVVLYVYNIYCR